MVSSSSPEWRVKSSKTRGSEVALKYFGTDVGAHSGMVTFHLWYLLIYHTICSHLSFQYIPVSFFFCLSCLFFFSSAVCTSKVLLGSGAAAAQSCTWCSGRGASAHSNPAEVQVTQSPSSFLVLFYVLLPVLLFHIFITHSVLQLFSFTSHLPLIYPAVQGLHLLLLLLQLNHSLNHLAHSILLLNAILDRSL